MVNKDGVFGDKDYDEWEAKFQKHRNHAKRVSDQYKAHLATLKSELYFHTILMSTHPIAQPCLSPQRPLVMFLEHIIAQLTLPLQKLEMFFKMG